MIGLNRGIYTVEISFFLNYKPPLNGNERLSGEMLLLKRSMIFTGLQ